MCMCLTSTGTWSEMENHGSGGYSGPNVMVVQNESSTDMSLVAMLASCSPVALQGGGLDDAVANSDQKRFFSPTFETSGEDPGEEDGGDDCSQHVEKKRRLSYEQVRSLEKSFEIENKLEPEKKLQLARDLSLQPRQVAVWFQNRRARYKTKQLERDFEVLTADYNRLKSEYDAVLFGNLELQTEIDCLTGFQPAQTSPVVDLPEKNAKSVTESHLSPQSRPSAESVELEILPELNASADRLKPRKEEGSRGTLSPDSISSEILNEDSPRTMDSRPLVPPEDISICPQISPEMDSVIIPLGNNLSDQSLFPLDCLSIPVKTEYGPEYGALEEDTCNYILSQLEDVNGVPWWEWSCL